MIIRLARKAARKVLTKVAGTAVVDPFSDMKRLLEAEQVETVFDVGGCYGVVARKFEEIFPAAHIFSFEPNGESFQILQKNVTGAPRITPINLGAYYEQTKMTLHLNAVPGSSSLLRRPDGGTTYHNPIAVHARAEDVDLVRLDDWAARSGIKRVDVLKLDIQGSELNALKGCTGFLPQTRVVYSEVQFHPVYQGACLLDEVWSFLRGYGFTLFQLYSVWGGQDGQIVQGDALFISDALRRAKLSRQGPVRGVSYFN